jgi:adenylate kinase family enzyme
MAKEGREFRCVEFLLDPEEATKRILGRAKAEGRADDADLAIISRRMATFAQKTRPVIEKYAKAGKMASIPADKGIDEVYVQLTSLVRSW